MKRAKHTRGSATALLLGSILAVASTMGCGGQRQAKSPARQGSDVPFVLGAPIEVVRGGIDTDALLGASAEGVLEQGATPLRVLASGAASEGDRVGGFVRVKRGACLVAYARGTADIEDLDVLTFDDAGTSLTADQAIRPNPAVVVCPPHPERIYVAARVASGHGLVALGAHAIEPERAAALAIKLGARMSPHEGEGLTREAWPGLSKRVEQRREALSGRWMVLRRLSLPVSPRAESYVSVPLPAARCLDVLVMPNEETRGLRVNIADETGAILARGADRGEDRVALVCSPVDTTITVGVRPRLGHGLAAVVLSRSESGAETELAIRPDARRVAPMQSLKEVRAQVATHLAPGRFGKARLVSHGPLEVGNAVLHSTRLEPGCTRLDVLAGKPITGMRAALWARDTLWASAEGGEQATLYACTKRRVDVEVEVQGQGQPGQHVVEARTEARSDASLHEHPLAAGRLMARLNAGGVLVPTASLNNVRAIEVDATHRGTYRLQVPRGTCKHVIAALGQGAIGLGLQVVDQRNRVVATSHGANVATVDVCGKGHAVRAEVRLKVSTGKTSALIASVL